MLTDDITPTLEKLRSERSAYLTWAANNSKAESLARFCVAYEFVSAEKTRERARGEAKSEEARVGTESARAGGAKATATAKEVEIRQAEAQRASASGGDFSRLVAREEAASRELTRAEVALASKRGGLKEDEKAAAGLAKQRGDAEKASAAQAQALAQARAEAGAAAAASESASGEVSSLMQRVNAAAAGMSLDEDGSGGGATLADQLIASKGRVSSLQGEISSGEMSAKHLRGVAKELAGAAKAAEAEARSNEAALAKAQRTLGEKQAKLAGSGFNAAEDDALRARREAAQGELGSRGELLESESAALGHLVDFSYDAAALGGRDAAAARVKGVLASLLSVTMPSAAVALEVGGGGKLYQVVVDTEVTGKALLERGRLGRRVTFIPLSHIRRNRVSDDKWAQAQKLGGGPSSVWRALDLVSYPPELAPAVEYAFGNFLIAKDAETARRVCFGVGVATVSLEGDAFDPSGTLEGGSKPEAGRDGGGLPTLLRVGRLTTERRACEALRAELASIEARLKGAASASAAYASLAGEAEVAAHEVSLLQARIATSQAGTTSAKQADTAAQLAAQEDKLAKAKAALGEAQERVKVQEKEAGNVKAAREERVKALEKALVSAKKSATAAEKRAKDASRHADELAADIDSGAAEAARLAAALAAAQEAVRKGAEGVAAAEAEVARLSAAAEAARAELEAARSALAAADKALKALSKERDAAARECEEAEAEAKKADARSKAAAKEAVAADHLARELMERHAWIASDRQFFGRPHTGFDFTAQDPAGALGELKALEKAQAELGRRINKKVVGMIESAEREYSDLVAKKRIIENDKAKINVSGTVWYPSAVRAA